MTENKRFECNGRIIRDNKTKLPYIMTLDWECRLVTKLLNQLNDENEQIKHAIIDSLANERTAIGKSVLKQLLESLERI